MKIDNLLIFSYSISFVAVSARELGILPDKMHAIWTRHLVCEIKGHFA